MNKFKVYDLDSQKDISVDIGKFPGGEIRVRLDLQNKEIGRNVHIHALLFNSDDVMTLVMLADALRDVQAKHIRLTMPYVPYARQDRRCNEGEAFSIRAFAELINNLHFSSIAVWDPHSVVTSNYLDRCVVVPSEELMKTHQGVQNWIEEHDGTPCYLVSPDAGSVEKSIAIGNSLPEVFSGIIFAEKVRDLETGKIVATRVAHIQEYDQNGILCLLSDNCVPTNAHLLICDDICDGGRTFIELAKVLQDLFNPASMSLYVTHGIFSQGLECLQKTGEFPPYAGKGLFDNVWSTVDFSKGFDK